MNQKLYDVCASIPDVDRKSDRGAFFKSIDGTLNHILVGDLIWLGRLFTQQPFVSKLDGELYSNFSELRIYQQCWLVDSGSIPISKVSVVVDFQVSEWVITHRAIGK